MGTDIFYVGLSTVWMTNFFFVCVWTIGILLAYLLLVRLVLVTNDFALISKMERLTNIYRKIIHDYWAGGINDF